jgi:hypothetical protein
MTTLVLFDLFLVMGGSANLSINAPMTSTAMNQMYVSDNPEPFM